MRDLIFYIASTFDGFLAYEDGSFDGFAWDEEFGADLFALFPERFPDHLRNDNFKRPNKWFDVVLMGRKTYEVGLQEGISNPYPSL